VNPWAHFFRVCYFWYLASLILAKITLKSVLLEVTEDPVLWSLLSLLEVRLQGGY